MAYCYTERDYVNIIEKTTYTGSIYLLVFILCSD